MNKNALSSGESRLLGDTFRCQRGWCCYTTFSFGIQNECICHNVKYSQRKNCMERQTQILASDRCEAFENLLHDDIAAVKRTLPGILHSKN